LQRGFAGLAKQVFERKAGVVFLQARWFRFLKNIMVMKKHKRV